jgi:hypothetical protein
VITQAQQNERDAKRYRMMRLMLCAPDERQDEIAALIDPIIGGHPTPQLVDRAIDHVLNTLKLV